MPLIIIEASSTQIAVVQGSLQEMSYVNLVPCVFNLGKQYLNLTKEIHTLSIVHSLMIVFNFKI